MKKFLLLGVLGAFLAGAMVQTSFAKPADAAAAAEKKKKKKKKGKKARDPEAIFKRLNKNGDDFLSEDEWVGKRKGKGLERAKKRWARMIKHAEKDKTKGLTLEEFKKASVRKKKKKKKGDA